MKLGFKGFWAKPLFMLAALSVMAVSAQAPTDVRVALVIGNSAYAGNMALTNPANDATAMSSALKSLGFTVIEARDGSRAQMEDAVKKLFASLKGKQGVGMLYYAGHGLQVGLRNYMVPVNAKLQTSKDVPSQTLEVGDVLDALKAAGTRMNIVVLDACRDNPFADKDVKGLAPVDAPTGSFLAYATAPGSVAEDGVGQNGLYTKHLLAELQKPVSIESVFKRVRLAVRKESNGRQIPWESTSLEEEFSFSSKTSVSSVSRGAQREADFAEQKAAWDKIKDSKNADDFYQFLANYPSGLLTEIAQARLQKVVSAQSNADPLRLDAKVAIPYLKVGDKWKTRYSIFRADSNRPREQFEYSYSVEGGAIDTLTVVGKSSSVWVPNLILVVTPEGAIVKRKQARGADVEYSPPAAQLPEGMLQLGKKYSTRVGYKNLKGELAFDDFDVGVVRKENLTTPAGSFTAFVLERVETIFDNFGGALKANVTAWYSENSRIPLKLIVEYPTLNTRIVEETLEIAQAK